MSKYLDFKVIKKHVRELRKTMTGSEKLLWSQLRNRQLSGYKFLRQHPIVYKVDFKGMRYFVADFYCHERKLIIELDGPVHDSNVEYDRFRDNELNDMGIRVLRIKNQELKKMDKVLELIKRTLELTNR